MLQAYIGDVLIIGVTKGNIDRLTHNKPMKIELLKPGTRIIYFVYGETKPDIIRRLEEQTDIQFEESHKRAAEADPL